MCTSPRPTGFRIVAALASSAFSSFCRQPKAKQESAAASASPGAGAGAAAAARGGLGPAAAPTLTCLVLPGRVRSGRHHVEHPTAPAGLAGEKHGGGGGLRVAAASRYTAGGCLSHTAVIITSWHTFFFFFFLLPIIVHVRRGLCGKGKAVHRVRRLYSCTPRGWMPTRHTAVPRWKSTAPSLCMSRVPWFVL